MIQTAAYLQMREAIETLRASLASLEEHFARFHSCGAPEELESAGVKVQDLYAQVEVLQQRLNRCRDSAAEGVAAPEMGPA
jgi:hypothetical protein